MRKRRPVPLLVAAVLAAATLFAAAGCAAPDADEAEMVEVRVERGAGTLQIARTLEEEGLISWPRLFTLYAALRAADGQLKAGTYRFRADAGWSEMVTALQGGHVVTRPLTVPEGFTLRRIAPRVADVSGVPPDSVLALTMDPAFARSLGVPGPHLEGYLFPDTYRFAEGVSPASILEAMVGRYRAFWGPEERARADELGLSEREVVTLASIVEAEARVPEERPVIAGVFLNRLERGMLLQADPTVQYALGERRQRLLYRDIERVADDPYNTYTHPGLPPGPIGSPGEAALRAVLEPADVPYLYFVARPDGSHAFTETLREHVEARNRIRR